MSKIISTKRIAKNTIMLYFRHILIMLVSLYTVRVVLNVLGVEDYGIYNVVGGIVAFFSFLKGTMASATQRFFSFSLGEQNQENLNKNFTVSLIIYLGIVLIAVFFLETIGLWFVYTKLNVPQERFSAVCWVYHFSILTFVFSMIVSPFMAMIVAHEDMQAYAYVSIIEAVLKLLIVYVLELVLWDKLKLYGILQFVVGVINALMYIIYCLIKYPECQFKRFYWDKQLFKESLDFTGWTLFGQITTVARVQAVTILVNQFFNPIVVSARTIATQVISQVNVFSSNFNTGLYPPIIKAYAAKEKESMFSLIFNGGKMTFFLMWIFSLPLFLNMDYVMTLWLKNPPEFCVLFTRLALIEVLINAVSMPIMTAARAPGRMKVYELSLGSIQLMIFVADLVLFQFFHAPAYIVFVVAAVGNVIMFFVRLIIVHYLIELSIWGFVKKVLVPLIIVMVVSAVPTYIVYKLLPTSFLFVCINIFVSVVCCCLSMIYIGLSKNERNTIYNKIISKIKKDNK